jgi:MFS family permease
MVSEGGGSAGRKTLALVLLCCASFVAVLDLTIVAIALPSVRRELGFTGGDVQWILTGYALSFGGLLLFMGRAGDLYGLRRLFVGGLTLFAAASFLGRLAWAPWVLVVARLLQGVGGARTVLAGVGFGHLCRGRGTESRYWRLRRDGWSWVRLRDGAWGCDH